MKKVCHLTTVHKRYDGRILKKECVSLANVGYDVTLLVADNKPDEVYCGVKIQSITFYPKNRLDRILHSKKHMLTKALEVDADIYHFHDPEVIPLGLKLIKQGKFVIYDSHEDYPLDIKYKKKWLPIGMCSLISIIFALYEKFAVKNFSAVISVTPQITNRFLLDNPKSYIITNYPILIKDIKQESRIHNFNICFAGAASHPWIHENLVRAIQDLDVNYLLAGPGTEQYIDYLKILDVNNRMSYLGVISQEQVFDLYEQGSLGMALALHDNTDFHGEGSLGVTKLFEYMALGLPVICTDFTLWAKIIDKWNCGICVNPSSIPDIKNAIEYFIKHPDVAMQMGQNARRAVLTEYNWSTQEKILKAVYAELGGKEE